MGQSVSGHRQSNIMQYQQLCLLSCLLGLPVISSIPQPQVLFRDSALVHQASHSHRSPLGSVSHNSHSVQDSSSAVHRHHTQATNQASRLRTLLSSPLTQTSHSVLQAPSLVQHADGRFFAVNANLQPGQLFQTADGRIFSLASSQASVLPAPISSPGPSAPAVPVAPLAPLAPVSPVNEDDDDVVIDVRDSAQNLENTEAPVLETTTLEPLEPITEAPVTRAAPISQPQTSRVIATAPFTSSTARFVSAVPAISQAPIPVTHISQNCPCSPHLPARPGCPCSPWWCSCPACC